MRTCTPWCLVLGLLAAQAAAQAPGDENRLDKLWLSGHLVRLGGGAGVSAGWSDRFEASVARQAVDAGAASAALTLSGQRLKLDVVGVKARLAGEALLDKDSPVPLVAVGIEHKSLNSGGLATTLDALGADRHSLDAYLTATQLIQGPALLLNGSLRLTRAHPVGMLGPGNGSHRTYSLQPEISAAWPLQKNLVLGAEIRFWPVALSASGRAVGPAGGAWQDVYLAWSPVRQVSLNAAWVDLGRAASVQPLQRQRGFFLALQITP